MHRLLLKHVEIYWDPGTMNPTHPVTSVWLPSTISSLVLSLCFHSSSISHFWVSKVSFGLWIHCGLVDTHGCRLTRRSTHQALTQAMQHWSELQNTQQLKDPGSLWSHGKEVMGEEDTPISTLKRLCEQHTVQKTEDPLGVCLSVTSYGSPTSFFSSLESRPPF